MAGLLTQNEQTCLMEKRQTTRSFSEVNTTLRGFVTRSTVGTFARLVATHGFRLVVDFAAALPANVAIFFLGGWNQPQTATRLAQNG